MKGRTFTITLAVLLFSAAYLLNSGMALPDPSTLPVDSEHFLSYALLFTATLLLFLGLIGDSSYARALYILTTLLLVMWFLNGWDALSVSPSFVNGPVSEALRIQSGVYPREPLAYILYPWVAFFGFDDVSLLFLHSYIIFLVASLMFFLVPKPSREMGFVLFGMFFSVPYVRASISTLSSSLFLLLLFKLLLAVGLNFTFVKNRGVAVFEVVVFAALTAATALLSPAALLVPVAFIITYPKGYRRNYLYLLLTTAFLLIENHFFGLPLPMWRTAVPEVPLKECAVPLSLLIYGLGEAHRMGIGRRGGVGQTWFLGWATLLFGLLYLILELPFLPLALVLSTFALRLVLLPSRTSRPQ
ncbi:hypothetical protein [Palaeococcus ferrophilus]|uniref:hypothetical protein n=1 Tax=Palaeococcus ferrophilus TaxID=83868 RepID=UPI00064EF52A|nr:hypothetical protein [Palaeococcus ferrophilus]